MKPYEPEPVMLPFNGWLSIGSSIPIYAREIELYPGWVKFTRDLYVRVGEPRSRHDHHQLTDPEIIPSDKITVIRPEDITP